MLNFFCKSQKPTISMLKLLKLETDQKKPNLSLNDFEFIQANNDGKLGVGTFAIVQLAKLKKSNKLLALKIVRNFYRYLYLSVQIEIKSNFSEVDKENLRREVLIHRRLKHPNIIKFYEVFEEKKKVYIVLEYAKHGNLFYYLHKYKRFSEIEAFKFFY